MRRLGRRPRAWPGWSPSGCCRSRGRRGSWSTWFVLGLAVTAVTDLDDRRPERRQGPGRGGRRHRRRARRRCGAGQHAGLRRRSAAGSRCCTSTSSSTTCPASARATPSTVGGIAHAIARHADRARHRARDHPAARHRHGGLHDRGRRPLRRVVRTVVEAMTALPSIVAGLFIYTRLHRRLGCPRSGLAAGARDRGDDAADHRPRRRRRAPGRPGRPARGQPRPRREPVAHGVARRAADRPPGPGHRGDPRRRPRHRRDQPGAAHLRRRDVHGRPTRPTAS